MRKENRTLENFSEIDENEALTVAKHEIKAHHEFLAKQDVDRIIEIKTEFEFGDAVYLHTLILFMTYKYKRERYRIILDGATETIIKGDIPPTNFSVL